MGHRRGEKQAAQTKQQQHPTAAMALALPLYAEDYKEAVADSTILIDEERENLAACEHAVDSLRLAFWAAGKALQAIRDGRLYRDATDRTFDAYCEERFQLSRRQVDRLIQAWPLAEVLAKNLESAPATLNEGQVRELIPLASKHGDDAAVLVYGTVATEGKVTAAVLAEAVAAVQDEFDPSTAADQIRAYLNREEAAPEVPLPRDPAAAWTVQTSRLRASVTKTLRQKEFLEAARSRPDETREIVRELQELLNGVLQELPDDESAGAAT